MLAVRGEEGEGGHRHENNETNRPLVGRVMS